MVMVMALSCMVWFSPPPPFSFSVLVEVAAVPLVWEVGHLGAFVLVESLDLFWRHPFQALAIYKPDPCHPPPLAEVGL